MSQLSANAKGVLDARYLRRGANGAIIETPGQLFEKSHGSMTDLPNGPSPSIPAARTVSGQRP